MATENYSTGLLYEVSEGKATLVGLGTCTDTDLIIPESYFNGEDDYPVTSIASEAFRNVYSLRSVVLPPLLTTIGAKAFYSCRNLTSITLNEELATINTDAFNYCDKLIEVINKSKLNITKGSAKNGYVAYYALAVHTDESKSVNKDGYLFYTIDGTNYLVNYIGTDTDITLPENYNGENYAVYKYAFYDNHSLHGVTIPDGVTSIGKSAFDLCTSLMNVTIGDSVTSIDSPAFGNCPRLTSIVVNENNSSYKSIDGNLYSKDGKTLIRYARGKSDTSFVIPNSVTRIGEHAFYGSSRLTSITIGNSVTSIDKNAFQDCLNLTSITIPDSVTSISDHAFGTCEKLTSITIGNSVTSIGKAAFTNCKKLTSITIPNCVKSIGEDAFRNCTQLQSITLDHPVNSLEGAVWGAPEDVQIAWIGAVGAENVEFYFLNDADTPCPAQGAISFGVKEDKGRLYITYNGKSYLVGESVDTLKVNEALDVSTITSSKEEISFDADTKVTFNHDTVVNGEFSANTTSVTDLSVTNFANFEAVSINESLTVDSDITTLGGSVITDRIYAASYDSSDPDDAPEDHTVVFDSPVQVPAIQTAQLNGSDGVIKIPESETLYVTNILGGDNEGDATFTGQIVCTQDLGVCGEIYRADEEGATSIGSAINFKTPITVDDALVLTTESVDNKNATLKWGTSVALAKVGGKDITAKLPAEPTFQVENKNATLQWNQTVTLGSVDQTNITAKLPPEPTFPVENKGATLSYTSAVTVAQVAGTNINIAALPKASQNSFGGVKIWQDGNILRISTT